MNKIFLIMLSGFLLLSCSSNLPKETTGMIVKINKQEKNNCQYWTGELIENGLTKNIMNFSVGTKDLADAIQLQYLNKENIKIKFYQNATLSCEPDIQRNVLVNINKVQNYNNE